MLVGSAARAAMEAPAARAAPIFSSAALAARVGRAVPAVGGVPVVKAVTLLARASTTRAARWSCTIALWPSTSWLLARPAMATWEAAAGPADRAASAVPLASMAHLGLLVRPARL